MFLDVTNTEWTSIFNDEVIALITFILLYLIYYFSNTFKSINRFSEKFKETKDNCEKTVYLRKTLGFILLGVIPFMITLVFFEKPIVDYGIKFPSGENLLLWVLIPTVVILALAILQPDKSVNIDYYPEVRKTHWHTKRHLINSFFWFLYLLGYEYALRGMIFFSSVYAFGLWPAIMLNCVIYSLIHVFKGFKEAMGTIFLGILFCLITFYTNSIWIVVFLHVLLAVMNDIKAVNLSKKTKEV